MTTLTTDDLEFIRDLPPATLIQLSDAIATQQTIALSEQVNHFTIEQLIEFLAETLGAGAVVSFGTVIPDNADGKDGDVFFKTDTGVIYARELGTWTLKINLTTAAELTAAITAHEAASDPHPIYLTQAEANALYAPIQGGAQGGLRYNLNLTTTSPPASGQVRFNNATLASVTQLFIHESDRNNAAQANILDVIALGTRIQIAVEDNEEAYAWFRATAAPTDNGTWRTVPVAFVSSAGTLPAGEVSIDLLQIQPPSSSGGAGGIGLTRTFSSTTTAGADDGTLRLNDVDPASATAIYISESTIELDGQAALLAKIAGGNLVQVTDLSNGLSSTYSVTGISDDGPYRTLTVAWQFGPAVAGDFAGPVLFQWLPDNSAPGSSLTVAEVDGTPSFTATTLEFPNGTLTDQGGGVARYTPTEGGGGGLAWQATTASNISMVANTGYLAALNGTQRFTLPSPTVGVLNSVTADDAGIKEIVGATIKLPNGDTNVGIRSLNTHPAASIELICTNASPARWTAHRFSDIAHWELFDPTGFDTDAIAVFTAIESILTANSLATSLLTGTIRSAVNNRILAKKSNNTWASTITYYGLIGGAITSNATASEAIDSINFRSPGTYNISAWTGGTFTRNALGTAANGTNRLANTGILVSKALFPDSGNVMGCYNTSVITEDDAYVISAGINAHTLYPRVGELRASSYGSGDVVYPNATANAARTKGMKAVIRISPTQIKLVASANISGAISAAPTSVANYGNLFLFSRSDGNFGSIASFGSFWANSATWSDSQISQEITDEVAYQTALSRQ